MSETQKTFEESFREGTKRKGLIEGVGAATSDLFATNIARRFAQAPDLPQPATAVEAIAVRGSTHGNFSDNAKLTQQLKDVVRAYVNEDGTHAWESLTPVMREGLDMLFLKVGRAVTGQSDFRDHWVDMAGYPQLVADRCK